MENNKKSGVLVGIVIGLLIGIIIGLVIFIITDKKDDDNKTDDKKQTSETKKEDKKKDENKKEDDNQKTDTNDTKDLSNQTFDLNNFDASKVINKDDRIVYNVESVKEASFSTNTVHPEIMVSTNQDVKVRVNWNDLCYLGKESKDYPYGINVGSDIRNVYVGGWGQSTGYTYIFYLMKDGTVEYTPLTCEKYANDAVSSDSFKLSSMGAIPNVSDIVMLAEITAGSANSGVGGHGTTLAIKADGSFYDLSLLFDFK